MNLNRLEENEYLFNSFHCLPWYKLRVENVEEKKYIHIYRLVLGHKIKYSNKYVMY